MALFAACAAVALVVVHFRDNDEPRMSLLAEQSARPLPVRRSGLLSLLAFTALILVPSLNSFGRGWEKATAAMLSLFVLIALLASGLRTRRDHRLLLERHQRLVRLGRPGGSRAVSQAVLGGDPGRVGHARVPAVGALERGGGAVAADAGGDRRRALGSRGGCRGRSLTPRRRLRAGHETRRRGAPAPARRGRRPAGVPDRVPAGDRPPIRAPSLPPTPSSTRDGRGDRRAARAPRPGIKPRAVDDGDARR